MSEDEQGQATDRQFVTSLARGLRIIAAFRPDERALSNQELAARTGLPRPTVSRFTHTLRKLNYLAYHERAGRYSLTPRVIELGHAAHVSTGIRDIARPAMEALSEIGAFSVALGVPSGLEIRYIELARRPEAIVLNLEVGALVPMLQTAIGRAYLAGLSQERRAEILSDLARADPALFAAQEEAVNAAVAGFEARGYAASMGGWWPELHAVATTISVVDGADPLLLSVSGLSSVMTAERIREEYAPALVNSAQIIQSRMRRLYPD